MTIDQLKEEVNRATSFGSDRVLLVIVRRSAPRESFCVVKGMGKGYIVNVQKEDGKFNVVAYFRLAGVKRYIGLYEKQMAGVTK